MKVLRCKDADFDCGFVASGASDCEVLDLEAAHVRKVHGIEPGSDRCGAWRGAIHDIPPSDMWPLG